MAEGVFAPVVDGAVCCVLAPAPPTDVEVGRLLATVRRRMLSLGRRHGIAVDSAAIDGGIADGLALAESALAAITGASVIGRVAAGPRAGHPVLRLRRPWRDGTRTIRCEPSERRGTLAAKHLVDRSPGRHPGGTSSLHDSSRVAMRR